MAKQFVNTGKEGDRNAYFLWYFAGVSTLAENWAQQTAKERMEHYLFNCFIGIAVVFMLLVAIQPFCIALWIAAKYWFVVLPLFLLLGLVRLVVFFVHGANPTELAETSTKIMLCAGFVVAGLAYYFLCEKYADLRLAVGLTKIVAALCSNWVQLSKFAQGAHGVYLFDRMAFIVAGMVVLSSGVKDCAKALQEMPEPASPAAAGASVPRL